MKGAAEYHSKDFEWEELRREVETDPSLAFHLSPFQPSSSSSSPPPPPSPSLSLSLSPCADSQAWSRFHSRHFTGKFFKCRSLDCLHFSENIRACINCFRSSGRGGINQGSWSSSMHHWMVIMFVSNVGDFHINTVEIEWGEQNEEEFRIFGMISGVLLTICRDCGSFSRLNRRIWQNCHQLCSSACETPYIQY